jgi:thiamine-phosphate pyrophosphorylase
MSTFPRHGLYAVTDTRLIPPGQLANAVKNAISGGAVAVQYRDKSKDKARRRDEAGQLAQLCSNHNVPLIINDDVDLAREVSAVGVHLGRDDISLANAREVLGPEAIIGVSCYNTLETAIDATRNGADYVAFGSFFHSSTKPDACVADPALLRIAATAITQPIVAIGGITPMNATTLIEAGAGLLAVISGVFAMPDIESAAHAYTVLFTQ